MRRRIATGSIAGEWAAPRRLAGAAIALGSILALLLAAPGFAQGPETTRVSVGSRGQQGNGDSFWPAISRHGRYVAFVSSATNLVRHSTRYRNQVLLRDRKAGETRRVSPAAFGSSDDPSISARGRYVAFYADDDVFVRDMRTGKTRRASLGASTGSGATGASDPSISATGRFIAFDSVAASPGVCRVQYMSEVFVRDRKLRRTTCISVNSDGRPGRLAGSVDPSISGDGSVVAFTSRAPGLVPNDTNGAADILVRDREAHTTERVSVSSSGAQADNQLGSTYAYSEHPSISANGRFVTFESWADNLVPGDTNEGEDIFVHDRLTGRTTQVNVSSAGAQANSTTYSPSISAGGRFVAFTSWADNLVAGDRNDGPDVFIRDRRLHQTTLGDLSSSGEQAANGAGGGGISSDGEWVAFASSSPNVVSGDTRKCADDYGDLYNCSDVLVRGPLLP
jgi:Tol biopolymer transport system component